MSMISAVFAIITDRIGRLVFVLGSRGVDIAGGQVEKFEDPIEALKREMAEELGNDQNYA